MALAAVMMTAAGCLQPPDTGTASSYGYMPAPAQSPSFVYQPGPAYNQPPHYLPPLYQPPPLSPNLTPETVRLPAVGHSPNPEGRYLPPPAPSASLLVPSPTPSSSLFGPQRPGWN